MAVLTVREKNGLTYSPKLTEVWNIESHPPLMTPHPNGGTYIYATNSENSYPTELVVDEEMNNIIALCTGKQQWYILDVVSKNGKPLTPSRTYAVPVNRIRKILPINYNGQSGYNYFFNHGGSGQPASWELIALGEIPTPVITVCEPPTNVQFVVQAGVNGFSQLAINWNAAAGVTSGNPKYRVYLSNRGVYWINDTNTNNFVWQGLVNGESYAIGVSTYCQNGSETTRTLDVPFSVNTGNTLADITSISTGSIASTSATVLFTAPTAAGVQYRVSYNIVGDTNILSISGSNSPIALTGLSPSTNYEYVIYTIINGQLARKTAVQTFTTLP